MMRAIILVRLLLRWAFSAALEMALCVSVGTFVRMWSRYRMPKMRVKVPMLISMLMVWVLSVLWLMMELSKRTKHTH